MKKIIVSDITLRECSASLSFKEKVEIAKYLDKLHCNIIEMPEIKNVSSDTLLIKTISTLMKHSEICVNVGLDASKIESIFSCVKNAKRSSLKVSVPVSTVQMEYVCNKKPPVVLAMVGELVAQCKKYSQEVEFSAEDAFRAEKQFLYDVIAEAVKNGATRINICDSEGTSIPAESEKMIADIKENVEGISSVIISVEIKNQFNMAMASAVASLCAGAEQIKTMVENYGYPVMEDVAKMLQFKGDALKISHSIKTTELKRTTSLIKNILHPVKAHDIVVSSNSDVESLTLDKNDTISTVMKEVKKIGYDLSPEDKNNVYEAFKRVADKKEYVGTKELEAIIASSTLQVPSTYIIDSYVINSGNIITATANIKLKKDGNIISGVSVGDGPIDASFRAIEQIIGHHYELDDFQIRAVTEGREAMGSAIVKLRSSKGKLYGGQGISTDIIGASIRAYVSALNKIAYEEG